MDCKYCFETMEMVSSWPVPNPYTPIAPAKAAYLKCPNCLAGFDTDNERWTPPDPYAEEKREPVIYLIKPNKEKVECAL